MFGFFKLLYNTKFFFIYLLFFCKVIKKIHQKCSKKNKKRVKIAKILKYLI